MGLIFIRGTTTHLNQHSESAFETGSSRACERHHCLCQLAWGLTEETERDLIFRNEFCMLLVYQAEMFVLRLGCACFSYLHKKLYWMKL
jgi:hypothetical protein